MAAGRERSGRRGAHVTATSRSRDKLDIFVVGLDGRVYTAAWEPGFGADWHGWRMIGDADFRKALPSTPMPAAPTSSIFPPTDGNGAILTSAWEPGFRDWRPWRQVAGGVANPGAHVTAVSRSTDKLDIFVSTHMLATEEPNGYVRTAAWELGGGDWRGWWPVGNMNTVNGAPVSAISRSTDKIDIFVSHVEFFIDDDSQIVPKFLGVQNVRVGARLHRVAPMAPRCRRL